MQILIALSVLLLFPVLCFAYSAYGFKKSPSKWKKFLPLYIYFVFIAAYSYTPPAHSNVDLLRYFTSVEGLKGVSLPEAVGIMSDSLYVENILFWIIAQTGMLHLLPAVTTATVYGIGAFIACDTAKEEDHPFLLRVLLFQLVMIPFFSVVVNIRNVFAFSVIVLASYLDLCKHKRNIGVLLLYILPVFMHKTGIIILALRILIPLLKRAYALVLVMIFGLAGLITFAYSHISMITYGGALGDILRKLIRSSYFYLLGESQYAERIRNSLGAAVTRYTVFAALILMILLYLKKFMSSEEVSDFEFMGYLLCIVSLSCNAIDTPAYWRFAATYFLLAPSLLYSLYKKELFDGIINLLLKYLIDIYLVFYLLLQIYRASILWGSTVQTLLFTNIYSLLLMLLRTALAF